MTSLQLKEDGDKKTRREKMENCVNTNFYWAISHFIVLTCLVSAANINPDSLNYNITERYSCTDPNWRDSPLELSNSPLELSNSPLPLRHSRLHPIYISRGQTRITYFSVEKTLKYGQ